MVGTPEYSIIKHAEINFYDAISTDTVLDAYVILTDMAYHVWYHISVHDLMPIGKYSNKRRHIDLIHVMWLPCQFAEQFEKS